MPIHEQSQSSRAFLQRSLAGRGPCANDELKIPRKQGAVVLEAIQALKSPGTRKGEKLFEGKNVGRLIGRGSRTSFLCLCEGASSPLQGMLHSHSQP